MKKSLLFVLTLLFSLAVPQLSVAQSQNRTMYVHLKGEKAPLTFDVSAIDSISFAENMAALTFEFTVDNIGMDGVDFSILPSDKSMTYYANYVPSSELKGMSDEEIIASNSQDIDESTLFQGDLVMTSAEVEMERDTEYTLFAFGYQNGRPNPSGLFKTTFRTLSEKPVVPGPDVTISGQVGDRNGNNKDTYIKFTMLCTSENASYGECLIVESKEIDSKLEEGYSLEEIAEGNKGSGYIMDRKELAMFNGVSFDLTLDSSDGVKPGTKYTCLLLAENWDGGRTVARADVETEASTEQNVKPELTIESWAGNAKGKNPSEDITFKLTCTTKNAAYCESFIMESSLVDNIGVSLEDLLTMNEGGGRKMSMDELSKMNAEGATVTWTGNRGDTSYAMLIILKNKQGERVFFRADQKTEPDALGYSVKSVQTGAKGTNLNLSAAQAGVKVVSLK